MEVVSGGGGGGLGHDGGEGTGASGGARPPGLAITLDIQSQAVLQRLTSSVPTNDDGDVFATKLEELETPTRIAVLRQVFKTVSDGYRASHLAPLALKYIKKEKNNHILQELKRDIQTVNTIKNVVA